MKKARRSDVSDGECWRCTQCKGRKSIRDGSFFAKSHITLQKWMILMFWWSREYSVTDAARDAEVDEGTAIDVYRWLREVCSTTLLNTPIVLGGPGVVVEIDESQFRHKPKVRVQISLCRRIQCKLHSISTIVEGLLHQMYGCLEWLIHPTLQHWATWRLFLTGPQQHSCQ